MRLVSGLVTSTTRRTQLIQWAKSSCPFANPPREAEETRVPSTPNSSDKPKLGLKKCGWLSHAFDNSIKLRRGLAC